MACRNDCGTEPAAAEKNALKERGVRQPITDREREQVVSLIASCEVLEQPTKILSELLLANFGWPPLTGKKRAALILQELEEAGKISCERNGRNKLTSVRMNPEEISVATTTPKITPLPAQTPYRQKPRERKKGRLRRIREQKERGDQNEDRFYGLMRNLGEALKNLPTEIHTVTVSKSGRHDPKQGKFDLKDRHGEDITIEIENATGKFRFIYDVKTSEAAASKFNTLIHYYHEQRDARLKKAIAVNKERLDAEIIREVMADFVSGGLSIEPECIEKAVRSF